MKYVNWIVLHKTSFKLFILENSWKYKPPCPTLRKKLESSMRGWIVCVRSLSARRRCWSPNTKRTSRASRTDSRTRSVYTSKNSCVQLCMQRLKAHSDRKYAGGARVGTIIRIMSLYSMHIHTEGAHTTARSVWMTAI